MKGSIIRGWDMNDRGINALTGEACAYNMRVLCDVNEDGRQLLSEFFGVDLKLNENWNSSVRFKDDAIGSIMLPHGLWKTIARFAFWHEGALAVTEHYDGALQGVFDQETLDRISEIHAESPGACYRCIYFNNSNPGQPRVGSRNVHSMTGRAV